jgi:hypothetical protein
MKSKIASPVRQNGLGHENKKNKLKRLSKKFITTLALSIVVSSCSVFGSLTSNVSIKANENFVLGNNEHGTFKSKIKNLSNHPVTIVMRPIDGGSHSPQTVMPNESATLKTQRNTALVIENKSNEAASIDLKVNGDTRLSMGYKNQFQKSKK